MKTTAEFWRNRWNELAKRSSSDFQADRGTALRIDELEQREARQFIKAVDPKPGDFILDAGCGTGAHFSQIGPLVAGIAGVDLSEEMLKRAERRISVERIPNVRLLHGDITKIEFPSGTFDKVICTSVLQYLNDGECERALLELVRVCKDGGTIVIHAKNRSSLYGLSLRLLRVIACVLRRRTTPDYYRSRAWYEEKIRRAGGRIVDYDSRGIFTFVPLPTAIVQRLLQMEGKWIKRKGLKKFGVNYRMTVRVEKHGVRGPQ